MDKRTGGGVRSGCSDREVGRAEDGGSGSGDVQPRDGDVSDALGYYRWDGTAFRYVWSARDRDFDRSSWACSDTAGDAKEDTDPEC